jgi:hypothetical protein
MTMVYTAPVWNQNSTRTICWRCLQRNCEFEVTVTIEFTMALSLTSRCSKGRTICWQLTVASPFPKCTLLLLLVVISPLKLVLLPLIHTLLLLLPPDALDSFSRIVKQLLSTEDMNAEAP